MTPVGFAGSRNEREKLDSTLNVVSVIINLSYGNYADKVVLMNDVRCKKIVLTIKKTRYLCFVALQRNINYTIIKVDWFLRSTIYF